MDSPIRSASEAAPTPGFAESLREAAALHGHAQIDLQTLIFQQGRDIARAYIDMMMSYARLSARAGRYVPQDGGMTVEGFCRIEAEHFGDPPPIQCKKHMQSILRTPIGELRTRSFTVQESDLFSAFCTSFAEFCTAEHIRSGALSVLVRKKDGSTELRPLPAVLFAGEHPEGFGFPYTIFF